jgi:predicted membrane chloride channel (bestrophin family)
MFLCIWHMSMCNKRWANAWLNFCNIYILVQDIYDNILGTCEHVLSTLITIALSIIVYMWAWVFLLCGLIPTLTYLIRLHVQYCGSYSTTHVGIQKIALVFGVYLAKLTCEATINISFFG